MKKSQIFFLLYRKIYKPKFSSKKNYSPPRPSFSWTKHNSYDEKINSNMTSNFLSIKKSLDLPKDWNDYKNSKLWSYNLHYFENLISNTHNKELNIKLLDAWIKDNPFNFGGNGWEPYTISLRTTNIMKYWLNGNSIISNHAKSTFEQLDYLYKIPEKHILANHYFANLKALFFGAIVFNNPKWFHFSYPELNKECNEQIHEDGGHFELSPMYHNIITNDLLDLYNLALSYPKVVPLSFKLMLQKKIPKMLFFLQSMSFDDNKVSHFNDSVHGIAPHNQNILSYAKKLGFEKPKEKNRIKNFKDSGYIISRQKSSKLIFDAAMIGPDYQPGHAHADSLSFEYSVLNSRVFVNSGISEYSQSKLRNYQRMTCSHNTIEINKKSSSQVWSSFRVANRAKTNIHKVEENKNFNLMKASHDGYSSFLNKCIHNRTIIHSNDYIKIIDNIDGVFSHATFRLFVHPENTIRQNENIIEIIGKFYKVYSNFEGLNYEINDCYYYPGFGQKISNKCIVVNMKSKNLELIFNTTLV